MTILDQVIADNKNVSIEEIKEAATKLSPKYSYFDDDNFGWKNLNSNVVLSNVDYSVMVIDEAVNAYFDGEDEFDDLAEAINSFFEQEDQFVPEEE